MVKFRIGQKTKEEYNRQVRNTKAKIRRVEKNYGVDLSTKIDIPSLDSFDSRSEFNQWVKKAERFRNRSVTDYQFEKNEYGVVASKKQLNKIERKTRKAQKLADKKIEELEDKPFYSGGKEQGTVGLQRPSKSGIYRPHDFDFSQVRSRQRLREIEESMDRKSDTLYYDERSKRMQENFINALEGSFNSLADELIEKIKNIPPDDFYQLYLMFDEFDFDYFDTDGQNVEADETAIGQMMKYIEMYERDGLGDLAHENFK